MKQILSIIIFLIIGSYGFSQIKDSIVPKTSKVLELNGKVIMEEFKFIKHLGDYRLVLDKENNLFYINNKGEKELNPIINTYASCGNLAYYVYEIIETSREYILTEKLCYDYDKEKNLPTRIGCISKKGIDKIYFARPHLLVGSSITLKNNPFDLKRVEISESIYDYRYTKIFPFAIIIEKKNKKGIFYENKLTFYDNIKYEDDLDLLKVEIKNRYGYFGITECKYEELEKFVHGLAKFKLPNGETGYIDGEGNEYK